MRRSIGSWQSRRRLLRFLGLAAGAGAVSIGAIASSSDPDDRSVVVRQDERCIPLQPLTGTQPVEDLYEYTYPTDEYDGPPGSHGYTYSSEGTTHLQRDNTSTLFLYDGPEGSSLVVVHGHLDGETDRGGTVSFRIRGLPREGEWIVRDDYYLTADGEQAASNRDRWDVDGDVHDVDWVYASGRTDGGAFRGLGTDFEVTIEPAFNERAALADDHEYGPIETWEVLSGDLENPNRHALQLDRPVTIQYGTCPGTDDDTGHDPTKTDDRTDVVVDEGTSDDVRTDGSVLVGADVELDGNVEAGGDVSVGSGGEIDGNVEAGGDVSIESGGEIDGNVEAGGDVSVDSGGEIDGNVEAGGDVTVGSGGEIDGNVEVDGDVSVASGGEIDGNVEAGGDVSVDPGGEIDGNVTGASVAVADPAEVDGTITRTDG